MLISELFFSIQGEGTRAGLPCVFVRTTGCDLRCTWCDTAYAFEGGRRASVEVLVEEVSRHPCRLVCLTGGEPLLQKELPALAEALLQRGYEVTVETHGQRDWSALPPEVVKIVDVKAPGSGELVGEADLARLETLGHRDELKFVLADESDFRWAEALIRARRLEGRFGALLLSPVAGKLAPERLVALLLASGLQARLQLQLHKIVWPPNTRGV
jgi:7-carboxy-7-deazaguanine synthase